MPPPVQSVRVTTFRKVIRRHMPPILMDVYHGDLEIVKEKIRQDPSLISVKSTAEEHFPDVGRIPKGSGLLVIASIRGHVAMVEWLLNNGADIYERNDDNFDAINAACWSGNTRMVSILLERANRDLTTSSDLGGRLNVSLQLGLIWAMIKGHEEIAKLLRQYQPIVENNNRVAVSAVSSSSCSAPTAIVMA